ncbi:MAG: type IV pilus assembly protein PilM [Candidatus Moranbacteria bacterium]|nr:type IV pilus assembly protein PilM [Candidatus Moranbacteria bacterium]
MSFLNKKIFNDSRSIFGLDLSDLSVKLVKFEKDGTEDRIVSFGSVPLSVGAISDGEIKKKDQVLAALKKLLEISGPKKIKTKKVICSLPETKAFLRIITIPKMNESEISEAVKWEMEANIPLSLEQVYYDWQLVTEALTTDKNKINLLVVAVSRTTVDETIEVIESAGLEVVGLEIESIAQNRSLLCKNDYNKTVLIVDIGDRRTSFSISKEGVPCFTSSVPLSGQTLTDVIAKGMGIPFEQAEKIKFSNGIGCDEKDGSLFSLVEPVLENFTREIERSIDFYLSGLGYSKSVDKIIICGGGANTKGIVPYLSKKLGREIELGNSWSNLNFGKKLPLIEKGHSLQYSTAIGLALKGLQYED